MIFFNAVLLGVDDVTHIEQAVRLFDQETSGLQGAVAENLPRQGGVLDLNELVVAGVQRQVNA